MNEMLKSHHPIRHAKSFKYAFEGIFHALLHEANFRIQVFIVLVSTFLGFYYRISNTEWGLLVICMGFLLVAEMVNTVVEEFMDHLITEYNEGVKIIKDMSAGFVLITSGVVLFILYLLFWHRVFI